MNILCVVLVFIGVTLSVHENLTTATNNDTSEDVFLEAINRHKYSTTTPKYLWQTFDEVINESRADGGVGISIEKIMDSWTNEAGNPIVYADRIDRDIRLKQVPMSIATSSASNFARTSPVECMGEKKTYISAGDSVSFVSNVQQNGFYRIKYDSHSCHLLISALYEKNYSKLHVTNRAQLIDDALNLTRATKISYDKTFECTDYLRNEKEYLPWKAFFNGINFLLQRSYGQQDNLTSVIKSYILHLTSKIYSSLDFENSIDDHLKQLKRELILTWRCKAEGKDCVKKAKQLYINFKLNTFMGLPNHISPNARAAVYCTAMRDADVNEWNFMWGQYLKADFASEKKTILEALGCNRNEKILRSYINRVINGSYTSGIRKQDVDIALTSIYNAGKVGVDVMLIFLVNEYKRLYEYYGEWNSVRNVFSKLASHISTQQQLKDLEMIGNCLKQYMPEISFELDKTVETARTNHNWYVVNANNIFKELNSTVSMWDARLNAKINLNSFSIISVTIFTIITYVLSH
ncbi:aminopeptidase N-like isoform X1 [Megalopta genalis]|uniref:aminopeptidase N-like isoform X1 n=2 Tax=Megalopta genalis TaxID=115081 RepID=UPI003FD3A402